MHYRKQSLKQKAHVLSVFREAGRTIPTSALGESSSRRQTELESPQASRTLSLEEESYSPQPAQCKNH